MAAYVYAAAGAGESTTDLAWDGHAAIYELGDQLAESSRFEKESTIVQADVDLGRIRQERLRNNGFADCALFEGGERVKRFRKVAFTLDAPRGKVAFNISGETVGDEAWLAGLRKRLVGRPDFAGRLIVEITESTLVVNAGHDQQVNQGDTATFQGSYVPLTGTAAEPRLVPISTGSEG